MTRAHAAIRVRLAADELASKRSGWVQKILSKIATRALHPIFSPSSLLHSRIGRQSSRSLARSFSVWLGRSAVALDCLHVVFTTTTRKQTCRQASMQGGTSSRACASTLGMRTGDFSRAVRALQRAHLLSWFAQQQQEDSRQFDVRCGQQIPVSEQQQLALTASKYLQPSSLSLYEHGACSRQVAEARWLGSSFA